ncbi:MAG: LLM class flavin-dependent oxidoreductase [Thermoleophilaceae bacterium]
MLKDALDQVEIADRAGFDCVWAVEHHFLEEYSHSSAPEVFLAAASQRTKDIRLGHDVMQIPPGVNHPARVAERVATLDLVSGAAWSSAPGSRARRLRRGRAQPRADHRGPLTPVAVSGVVPRPAWPGWSARCLSGSVGWRFSGAPVRSALKRR